MNKRAYYNQEEKESKPAKNGDLPISSKENDIAAEGANGFNLLEMGYEGFGQDPDQYGKKRKKSKDHSISEVIDYLVELGDVADKSGNNVFADFTDFLLIKYAETEQNEDIEMLFNQLMIKIVSADLPDTNEVLKKLTKIYNRTILLEYSKNNNLEKAKESAYKKVVHRADQYMTEI